MSPIKRVLFFALSLLILFLLFVVTLRQLSNSTDIAKWNTIYPDQSKIQIGMTRDETRAKLGTPLWTGEIDINDLVSCDYYTKVKIGHIGIFELPYFANGPCFDSQGNYRAYGSNVLSLSIISSNTQHPGLLNKFVPK